MLSPQVIGRSTENFDQMLSRRPVSASPSNGLIAFQNIKVVKRISKAKFPVYYASSNVTDEHYAMKLYPTNKDNNKPCFYYKNETKFAFLKHPNVIDIVYYQDQREVILENELKKVSYMLMEYAPHGDFFEFLSKHKESSDEKLVRTYFRQLIEGLEYLHANNVAHLDLKLDNLLIGEDFNLKIADFDLSHIIGEKDILSRGTKGYRGPEFFRTTTGEPNLKNPLAADIYSVGIMLFVLKSGGIYPHFENTTIEGLDLVSLMYNNNEEFWKKHCQIQEKKTSFYDKSFKELYNGMTRFNPDQRMSIEQIKKSKWYNGPVYKGAELQKKMRKILSL